MQSGGPTSAPLSLDGLTGVDEVVGVADSGLNDGEYTYSVLW